MPRRHLSGPCGLNFFAEVSDGEETGATAAVSVVATRRAAGATMTPTVADKATQTECGPEVEGLSLVERVACFALLTKGGASAALLTEWQATVRARGD
jgi:hypothetical protein